MLLPIIHDLYMICLLFTLESLIPCLCKQTYNKIDSDSENVNDKYNWSNRFKYKNLSKRLGM